LLCDLNIQAVPANSCVQRKDTDRLLLRSVASNRGSPWILRLLLFPFYVPERNSIYVRARLRVRARDARLLFYLEEKKEMRRSMRSRDN